MLHFPLAHQKSTILNKLRLYNFENHLINTRKPLFLFTTNHTKSVKNQHETTTNNILIIFTPKNSEKHQSYKQ